MSIRKILSRNDINLIKNIQDLNNRVSNQKFFPTLITVEFRQNYSNFCRNKYKSFLPRPSLVQTATRFQKVDTQVSKIAKEVDKPPEKIIVTDVPVSAKEKLKKALKEYGSTVIVFHITISLMSLGTCYLLVTSGLDATKIFTALGLEDWLAKSQIATNAGTFAVAYAIHKVFTPARIAITLTSVPLIVRYLRRIGFLKK